MCQTYRLKIYFVQPVMRRQWEH